MKIDNILKKKNKIKKYIKKNLDLDAINLIDEFVQKEGFLTELLIKKIQLILLLGDKDDDKFGTLDDLKKMFENILKVDEKSILALTEYSHFLYAIMDDNKNALKNAKLAKKICEEYLKDIQNLINECMEK